MTTHSIDLIDEDDARCIFFGLLEQVTDATCTHTNKHLHKLRTGDGEERHSCLTSNGFGEKGFTGSGRANQQTTLGDLRPNGSEAIRVLEEVDHFGELELGSFNARHITKSDLRGWLHLNPSLALPEIHCGVTASAALGAAEEEEQSSQQKQREQQAAGSLLPSPGLTRRLHCDINVVIRQQLEQILVWSKVDLSAAPVVLDNHSRAPIWGNGDAADLVFLNSLNKIAVAQSASSGCGVGTIKEGSAHRDDHDHKQDVKADVAPTLVQGSLASDEGMLIEILRDQAARSTSTTLLKANHSGISSPLRSILRNWVPLSFFTCRPRVSACSAVT